MSRTYQRAPMQWLVSPAGDQPMQMSITLGSGETFKEGEIVKNEYGVIRKCGPAASGKVLAADMPGLFGIAQSDAANILTDGECPVWLGSEMNFFEGTLIDGDNPGTAYACVAADFGTVMGLYYDADEDRYYLDKSVKSGTTVRVYVYRLARDAQIGDSDAPAVFTFMPKFYTAAATS